MKEKKVYLAVTSGQKFKNSITNELLPEQIPIFKYF